METPLFGNRNFDPMRVLDADLDVVLDSGCPILQGKEGLMALELQARRLTIPRSVLIRVDDVIQ